MHYSVMAGIRNLKLDNNGGTSMLIRKERDIFDDDVEESGGFDLTEMMELDERFSGELSDDACQPSDEPYDPLPPDTDPWSASDRHKRKRTRKRGL
jgi:hypothetical protein